MGHEIFSFITFAYTFLLILVLRFRPSSSIDAGCDFFEGSWIYDDSLSTYNASMCSFIEKQFDCVGNGRPDKLYLKYRWKPSGCELPKFSEQDFLTRFQGKKIMFVGDSLSLNQWQSLTCMLHTAIPQSSFTLKKIGSLSTFYIPDYNISLMLDRNAFLVDLVIDPKKGRVLKLDSIQNGNSWIGYDMLIFNTWHWWLHKGNQKPWDYLQQGNKFYKDMDRLTAFSKGLKTWSKWVDSNINSSETMVLFQGISPTHYNGSEWNAPKGSTCNGESQPISGPVYPGAAMPAVGVVKGVLSKMTTAVQLLDVTTLSELRKDGHPSVYGIGGQKGNDCSHWCLAGVPDTWNKLLYAISSKCSTGAGPTNRKRTTVCPENMAHRFHLLFFCFCAPIDAVNNSRLLFVFKSGHRIDW